MTQQRQKSYKERTKSNGPLMTIEEVAKGSSELFERVDLLLAKIKNEINRIPN